MDWKKWWPVVFLTGLLVIILAAGLTNEIINYCVNSGVEFSPKVENTDYYIVKTPPGELSQGGLYLIAVSEEGALVESGSIHKVDENSQLNSILRDQIRRTPGQEITFATGKP